VTSDQHELESPAPVAAVRPDQISVVVCAYTLNRWDDVQQAVRSLLLQQAPVGEIILVIDHNGELLDRCRQVWPELQVMASTGVKGLSGARDTGWQAARCDVVAFLDDDARAKPDWSAALAASYGPGVLGVGGLIDPLWPPTGRPTWWPRAFDWVVGCSYQGMPQQRTEVRNVIGANMSVRRDVLAAVGGFDQRVGRIDTVPMGAEETEMYIRARAAHPGEAVIFDPAARVDHRVGPERATWGYFASRCYGEGRSKAIVADLNGTDAALSTELDYVRRTLPAAFSRGLFSSDPRMAFAVALGLGATGVGYLRQRFGRAAATATASSSGPSSVPMASTRPQPATRVAGRPVGDGEVTMVVCCYDMRRLAMLEGCLQSLTKQERQPAKVIVVIDGCDELAQALVVRGGTETLVPLPVNGGLSKARNAGLALVETEWVGFLDDDAEADPQWLSLLLAGADDPMVAGVGGSSLPWFDGETPGWFPPELYWTVGCSYLGLPTERAAVRNLFGGCAVFRTEMLREVGGFDVRLGRVGADRRGGEEADVCLRVVERHPAVRFFHEPAAAIRHRVPGDRARPGYILSRCLAEGRSKAVVSRLRGGGALSSERRFVLAIPLGMARLVREKRPDAALTLLGGAGASAVGYVRGMVGGGH
jgi:glucosyl-dolichyl phosphate glucuronosyltransferase